MRKCLSSVLFTTAIVMACSALGLRAEPHPDPAPPKSAVLDAKPAPAPQPFERLKFHAEPKPLNAKAKTSDWRRLLGPNDDATSPETHLLHEFAAGEPANVWEVQKGEGYTSPAIEGDFLVMFHALGTRETI